MEYKDDEYLMLSGLQHFSFCRRQWALIHIEQQWKENYRTVAGEILHERAHDECLVERRKNVIISRGINISSRNLGLNGTCDVDVLYSKSVLILWRVQAEISCRIHNGITRASRKIRERDA